MKKIDSIVVILNEAKLSEGSGPSSILLIQIPHDARNDTYLRMSIIIRPATKLDAELLAHFIRNLAIYERLESECKVSAELLREHLFGTRPAAEAVIAECDGKPEGFALFFTTFSTFVAKPSLYLEDLFVNPDARGKGIGKALLMHLVQLANERAYGRVEWAVLDWNEPAIGFYKKLGAVVMDDWHVFRLTEDVIQRLSTKPELT